MARGRGGYRGSFRGHGGYYAVQYRPPAYRGGRGRGRGRARGRGMPTDRSFYQRSRDGTKLTLVRPSSSRVLCKYFLRGACTAGRGCLFSHDQRKLCPLFVAGRCRADANCRLGAQEVTEYNRPVCEGFLQGRCEKGDDCNLGHVYTGRVACPDFTEFGMCGEGSKCAKMHSMFCPRYGDAGGCPDPLCKMAHKSAPERMLAQKGLIEVPEEVEKAAGARFKWTRPAKRGRAFGAAEIRNARKEMDKPDKPDGRFFSPANIAMVAGEFMSLEVSPEEQMEGKRSFMEREERRKAKQKMENEDEAEDAEGETQDGEDAQGQGDGDKEIDKAKRKLEEMNEAQ